MNTTCITMKPAANYARCFLKCLRKTRDICLFLFVSRSSKMLDQLTVLKMMNYSDFEGYSRGQFIIYCDMYQILKALLVCTLC